MPNPIRVLVVDDSPNMRRVLVDALRSDPAITVIGQAGDPFEARDLIVALRPDVVTLDIEMPRMDGLTFLGKLMAKLPMPVIVVSTLCQSGSRAVVDALRLGAVEALVKPNGSKELAAFRQQLLAKVHAAASSRRPSLNLPQPVAKPAPAPGAAAEPGPPSRRILAIGASTGGTQAIEALLHQLPARIPGMVVVQHIPPVFSRSFAERLNQFCPQMAKEAEDGDVVRDGLVLVAPGGIHMVLARGPQGLCVRLRQGPQVHYQRPAVDVLFRSVAEVAGKDAVGALLTGMGADGAQGLLQMRSHGCWTIAQNEESCVVYGMPQAAVEIDAACEVVHLRRMGAALMARFPGFGGDPRAIHQELAPANSR